MCQILRLIAILLYLFCSIGNVPCNAVLNEQEAQEIINICGKSVGLKAPGHTRQVQDGATESRTRRTRSYKEYGESPYKQWSICSECETLHASLEAFLDEKRAAALQALHTSFGGK